MKTSLLNTLISSFLLLSFFTLLLGVAYPLTLRGFGFAFFPIEACGSLLKSSSGSFVGSSLIGQNFSADKYFHPRPSYAGKNGYDAMHSDASFLGPTSKELAHSLAERSASYRAANGLSDKTPLPADAIMSSASGLDPHISIENAKMQMARVAKSRNISPDNLIKLIDSLAQKSWLMPNSYLNVLEINTELDKNWTGPSHAAQ